MVKPNIGDTIIYSDDYGVVLELKGAYNNDVIYYSYKYEEKRVIFYASIKSIIRRPLNSVLESIIDNKKGDE